MTLFRAILIIILWDCQKGWAVDVFGRITMGGYTATERFVESESGSNTNDMMVISTRFYTKISELSKYKLEMTSDFRDKHDFFDKLDREKLELLDRNDFQVRQLNLRYPNLNGNWGGTLGRFYLNEAGAIYVDGIQSEWHLKSWNASFFGGFNPKRSDQTYVQWNSNSMLYGIASSYQDNSSELKKAFLLSHALVNQSVGNELDRSYFFHNLAYQWMENSRILTLLYLDFVPRTYLQTGQLQWQQGYSSKLYSQLELLSMDVIEYTRRQGVRERLVPSPFKESSLKWNYLMETRNYIELKGSYGERAIDKLKKSELSLGYQHTQLWSAHWDFNSKIGLRDNFTSKDQFVQMGIGYFARKWEGNFDVEYGIEKQIDGEEFHPIVIELSLSHYFSKELFGIVSFQSASDERVSIQTGFFKFGYRFGSQGVPPVRDGAPNIRGYL